MVKKLHVITKANRLRGGLIYSCQKYYILESMEFERLQLDFFNSFSLSGLARELLIILRGGNSGGKT